MGVFPFVFSPFFPPPPFVFLQFMDLRTRYTALVTLMTQHIKFAGDSLKRLEEEEVGHLLAVNQAKRTARQATYLLDLLTKSAAELKDYNSF